MTMRASVLAFLMVLAIADTPLAQQAIQDQRIILVHGFLSSPSTWSTLVSEWPTEKSYIRSQNLLTPELTWRNHVSDQAAELDTELGPLSPGWVMIGHSQGGLVARSYKRRRPGAPVQSLTTIASPNSGAPVAARSGTAGDYIYQLSRAIETGFCTITFGNCAAPSDEFVSWHNLISVLANELLPRAIVPSMGDMIPGSSQLQALNTSAEPVKTAALYVWDAPRAEVVKLAGSQLGWSEARSETAFTSAQTILQGLQVSQTPSANCIGRRVERLASALLAHNFLRDGVN